LTGQVTGATEWHINADEPSVIDYNVEYKPQDFYAPDAYRSSDHDPVVVGLNLVNQTALTVTKDVVPAMDVEVGDIVTYTVTLSNAGSAMATGVVMTDVLPMHVEPGGWVSEGSASIPMTRTLTWGPWDVTADTEVTYVFTATVVAESDQPVVNTVEFISENAGVGEAEAAFEMTLLSPTLSIAKTVDPAADVIVGDTVTYTIALENIGTGTAEGIALTDTLPSEIDFGGWAMGHNLDAVEQGGVITWTGDLPSGVQPGVIAFTATVSAESAQPVTNTVEFTSDNAGVGEAEAAFEMTLLSPTLSIAKTVDPAADVVVGDTVTYTITLSNIGGAMAAGVVMTDVLPREVEPGGWVSEGSASIPMTRTLVWGPWDVAAGANITYVFTATVIAESDQPVVNRVDATADNAEAVFATAEFSFAGKNYIFLPLVTKH
jgi:uncharacterized repeat protein (TIGR01451 family)